MPEKEPLRPASPETAAQPRSFGNLRHAFGGDDDLPIDPDLDLDDPRAPAQSHRAHTAPPVRARAPRILAAVFAGGALGTVARYALESAWAQPPGHFPVTTFVVNTAGAFLLGLVLTVLLERLPSVSGDLLRPFLCTGVLGGWTTYSTLVVDADRLIEGGHAVLGAGYVAITLVCGLVAAALGIAFGRARVPAGGRAQ